jgi:hypothetical protein
VVSFLQVSPPKPCMHLSSPPHVLQALSQILFLALQDYFYTTKNLYQAFVRLPSTVFTQLHIYYFNITNSA